MTTHALENFKSLINTMTSELSHYAKLPNAKPAYIQKQNQRIAALVNIYNQFAQVKYLQHWIEVESWIRKAESQDPNLGGHLIEIHRKPTGAYSSYPLSI